MKVSYRKYGSTLAVVLLGFAVFAAQSVYASCLVNFTTSEGEHGFVSCGSSAGPYAMICSGNGPCTDVTDQYQGLVKFICAMGCGDDGPEMEIPSVDLRHSIIEQSIPSRFILTYPGSYKAARLTFVESKQMQWRSLFVDTEMRYSAVLSE